MDAAVFDLVSNGGDWLARTPFRLLQSRGGALGWFSSFAGGGNGRFLSIEQQIQQATYLCMGRSGKSVQIGFGEGRDVVRELRMIEVHDNRIPFRDDYPGIYRARHER